MFTWTADYSDGTRETFNALNIVSAYDRAKELLTTKPAGTVLVSVNR